MTISSAGIKQKDRFNEAALDYALCGNFQRMQDFMLWD